MSEMLACRDTNQEALIRTQQAKEPLAKSKSHSPQASAWGSEPLIESWNRFNGF